MILIVEIALGVALGLLIFHHWRYVLRLLNYFIWGAVFVVAAYKIGGTQTWSTQNSSQVWSALANILGWLIMIVFTTTIFGLLLFGPIAYWIGELQHWRRRRRRHEVRRSSNIVGL